MSSPDIQQAQAQAQVRVHRYSDGQLAVFHGPRCLARYDARGKESKPRFKAAA